MTRYLDASALVKLVIEEHESKELRSHLVTSPDTAVTSLIAAAEVGIAVTRRGAAGSENVTSRLGWLMTPSLSALGMPLTPEISARAAEIGAEHRLRALDAIHVATAAELQPALMELVTYDERMIAACATLGIPAVFPGRD